MFGAKTYELPLTRDYVRNWGVEHAIRELIQNALDSESPFKYEFSRIDEEDRWTLRLVSEFTKLLPKTLLLGSTTKLGDETAIGSFGEGYKIALLVLTREGYDVEMHNDDVMWKPSFKHSRQFGAEILVITETVLADKTNKGLTVIVQGLSDEEVRTTREFCLNMQDNIGAIKQSSYGEILLEIPGKLFVGGLYICMTGMGYGYNIKPEHIRLERDRQTVSDWDLKDVTLKMWLATEEYDRIAKMIADDWPDLDHARWSLPEIVKEHCYRLFREQHPGAVVAQSQSELQDLVKKGMTRVVTVGGGYYHAISTHKPYIEETPKTAARKPKEVLLDWHKEHKGCLTEEAASDFDVIIDRSHWWKDA